MNEGLYKNDPARPAVQKVETLVRYTSEHTQDRIASTKRDCQGSESEGECTKSVAESTDTTAEIEQISALDRSLPALVCDSYQTDIP